MAAMNISAIYLDLDGVLVDFVGGVFRAFGVEGTAKHENVRGWDEIPAEVTRALREQGRLLSAGAITDAAMWRQIEGAAFWANLDWLAHGRELLAVVEETGLPLVFMSAPCRDPFSAAGKLQWLEQHVPSGVRRYALTPCKHHMAHRGALLIDDGEHNVEAFRKHDGKAFLWPGPWNRYGCMPSSDTVARLRQVLATAKRLAA